MKYILIIATFNALFFAILILQKKRTVHDKIMTAWLVYLGIYVGLYAVFSDVLFTKYQLFSASFISLLLLHGPFLYLYISSLTNDKFQISWKNLIHFTPFVLFNLYIVLASFFPHYAQKIRLDHSDNVHGTAYFFNLFLILTVLSGPVYILLTIRLFRKLDINIFNNFSVSKNVSLDWMRKLIYTFGVVWTVLLIFTTVHHVFGLFSWSFCTNGLFLSLSVFILLIGFLGLNQKEIFVQYPDKQIEYVIDEPKAKYATTLLKEDEMDDYIKKIEQYMDIEKPYLNADISLPELSERMNIPSHHLSRVINEKLNMNFFDFINQYRVEEVKSRIQDPQYVHLSILGIAFDSGFNTKSAFNRVFKKMTGMTPSEFKRS